MKKVKSFFYSIIRIILILAICLGAAFLIVWPLWKFATTSSKAYTIVILILLAAWIIYLIVRRILNSASKRKENAK